MDFTTDGILSRMKEALKNEDTKIEGSFTMDNLQAVSEELARFNAMRIVPLMNTLSDKEDDMGTSGNPKHYVRWAKEATDADGNVIAGNAKVETPRDGSGFVSIAIITTDAKIPSAEQMRLKAALDDLKGRFILSYNDDDFVRELYKGYHIEEISRNLGITNKEEAKSFDELIIRNY